MTYSSRVVTTKVCFLSGFLHGLVSIFRLGLFKGAFVDLVLSEHYHRLFNAEQPVKRVVITSTT